MLSNLTSFSNVGSIQFKEAQNALYTTIGNEPLLVYFSIASVLTCMLCTHWAVYFKKKAVNEQWIFHDWLYNFVDYSLEQTVKPTEIVQEVKQYYKWAILSLSYQLNTIIFMSYIGSFHFQTNLLAD